MSGNQKYTVNLVDLPEDILLIILNMLNSFDKYNVYCTCSKLKYLVCTSTVSKSQCFSLSQFASSEYLNCQFIKDVSMYIQDLNLCAVQNLSKSVLVPCLRRMPNLKLLNVCYTNIVIPDLLDVVNKCSLKTLCINFKIYAKNRTKVPPDVLKQCQKIFENVENVHFVGSIENLFLSTLPIFLLEKASALKDLKFTVLKKFSGVVYQNEHVVNCRQLKLQFTKFSLHFCEWWYNEEFKIQFPFSPLFHLLESNLNIQFVVVDTVDLFVSGGLISHFQNNLSNSLLNIKMCSSLNGNILYDNATIIIWNNDKIILNKLFLEEVAKEIKNIIPNNIVYKDNKKELVRNYNDYFQVNYFTDVEQSVRTSNDKRRRIAPPANILDFNDLFENHPKINFFLNFVGPPVEVKISPESDYLKKIALLHLNGFVKYGCDFFFVLFKQCTNLRTFIVTDFKCHFKGFSDLIKNLPQASALKNFMFHGDKINYNLLLESLSKCPNLENIFISELSTNLFNQDYETPAGIINSLKKLISKSEKLYNLYIRISVSDTTRSSLRKELHKFRKYLNKNYLNIEIYDNKASYMGPSYDPYLKVYDLQPINDS